LSEKGYKVISQKWIQSGCRGFSPDIKRHLKIMGKEIKGLRSYLPQISPYVFKLGASAHLASAVERQRVSQAKIKNSFRVLSRKFDFVVVEGIGGVLVPFNKKRLVIDIVRDLHLPVLIVAENKLGAINQTLLTIEALKRRKIKILGIIFNRLKQGNKLILRDNPKIIACLTGEKILGEIPREKRIDLLYKNFSPIAKKILKAFDNERMDK
jgi:dethiobiotin synthetase